MAMHFELRDCDNDDVVVEIWMGDRGLETLTMCGVHGGWEVTGRGCEEGGLPKSMHSGYKAVCVFPDGCVGFRGLGRSRAGAVKTVVSPWRCISDFELR